MRTYIAHNMDENKDLLSNLETTNSEATIAQKLAEEGVSLLRKAEEENKISQVEALQLAKEKKALVVDNKKAEEEVARLK